MLNHQTVEPCSTGRESYSRYTLYDRFAPVYNRQFGFFAQRVLPALEELLLRHLPVRAQILDVCCGTGQLAAAMTDRGFRVTGLDGSDEMLAYARRNAPGARFVLEDARTFDFAPQYQAAVSTFDSLNHILGDGELQAVFSKVLRALQPGGVFVFDMNVEEGFLARWWGRFEGTEAGTPYAIEAIYRPEEQRGRNVVTLFDETGVARHQFSFVERCYSQAEIRDALRVAGFQDVSVFDGHRDLNLFGEVGRSFFVCRKPGKPAHVTAAQNPETSSESSGMPPGDTPAAEVFQRVRYREIDQCIADNLWPHDAVEPHFGANSKRLQALEEVLCTLPPKEYETLQQQSGRFQWYIPHSLILGQVHPFAAVEPAEGKGRYARVVFLSQLLEQHDRAVVLTVVAHELAHVILDHQLHNLDHSLYEQQEQQARAALCRWGYRSECEAAEATLREIEADRTGAAAAKSRICRPIDGREL